MPSSGPAATATPARPSVTGLAGQRPVSQPATAATMKKGLPKPASRGRAGGGGTRNSSGSAARSGTPVNGPFRGWTRAMIEGMAWDFSTDPEFQEQLDWMREFVRAEVWPIETVFDELGEEGWKRAIRPLQEQVKERGLWAAHLPPDL